MAEPEDLEQADLRQENLGQEKVAQRPAPVGEGGPGLRILQVAHKFPPFIGGIETHTFEVSRRMVERGHHVTVITGDASRKLPAEDMLAGIHVRRVTAYPRGSDMFFAPAVYGAIAAGRWDVAHVQGFHTFVPPIAMAAAIRHDLPFVFTFHSGGHSSPWRNAVRGAQRALLRPLLLRAARLIGVSEFEAEHFSRGLRLPRPQIAVVPNGAQMIPPPSDVKPPDASRPMLLSIGRLERYKGHHRAIEAFAELTKTWPQARLSILGEGPFKDHLVALVSQFGLGDKVSIGGIPSSNRAGMAEAMASASLIVLMSEYEAHPVAALEAISLQRPVLALNSTGFQEMAQKGLLRAIDPHSDARAIAAAMDEELRRPAASRPPCDIQDWDRCASSLIDIYRSVVQERTARGRIDSRETAKPVPLTSL